MYTLNIINNYSLPISIGGYSINYNTTYSLSQGGTAYIEVPGIGQICIIDLGMEKLEQYPTLKESWGILIRFQGVEVYARYEDNQGIYNLTIDNCGELFVKNQGGSAILISLPGVILQQ